MLNQASLGSNPLDPIQSELKAIIDSMERTVVGKRTIMEYLVTAILAGGHVLLDDVPGVGKTTMAKTLANTMNLSHKRIQCTPDLLPSDITGVTIFNPGLQRFEFQPGPIFAHLVLADEVNRTSPRTQSALLEVMEEGQVTVDGETHQVEGPFLVIATQNPIEYEGTFPLPESQLDRFLFRLTIGYPSVDEEVQIMTRSDRPAPVDTEPVISRERLKELMQDVSAVHVSPAVRHYIAEIAYATRNSNRIYLGMSPRCTLALYRACQSWALLHSRSYVVPDDVLTLAPHVVEHRLILARSGSNPSPDLVHEVFQAVLSSVPIPAAETP